MRIDTNSPKRWTLGKRAILLLLSALTSGCVGYWGQPLLVQNSNAVNTIVTVFSILAGFLIAVITFIAEPVMKNARNWEELQLMKSTVERQMTRHKILFFLYLVTLGLALSMFLLPASFVETLKWFQVVFLGLACFVFLLSFALPGSLMQLQMDKYEAALEDAKPKALKNTQESQS
ncbi:hypothetical protein ACMG4P_15550 [Pseudovibrio denitrificans]|uniref:hypothetical protein n=1 Tax=Pseudovibrio denitrificans TaxID=258256 RepID=UPI0039BF8393